MSRLWIIGPTHVQAAPGTAPPLGKRAHVVISEPLNDRS